MRKITLITFVSFVISFNAAAVRALDLSLPESLGDPWNTSAATSPDASTPWRGDILLPAVPESSADTRIDFEKKLTLIQLTDLALRNNPQTQFAWAVAQADAAAVGIAKADYLPQIDGLVSISSSKSASSSGSAVPLQTRYGPSISLSYLLLDFGTRAARLQAAQYNLLASNLNQNQVIQNVILQVEQAYYLLLGLQSLESANHQSLKTAQANLDAANVRRKSGLATIGDVFQAETAVAQAQLVLRTTQGQIANAQGDLANAVAVPVTQALTLEPLPADTPIQPLTHSVDQLIKQAKAGRPELIAAQAQVGAAQAGIKLAAGLGKPTLSLTGGAFQTEILDQTSIDGYNVGLTLRVPLFTGFRTTYAVRQSRAQLEQARASRDDLRNLVELQVWQAFYNQQTAVATIESATVLLRTAVQAAEVASARYRAGIGTILEVLSTQAAEANARVQNIQSQLDWYIALAQLGHAVGAFQPNEGNTILP